MTEIILSGFTAEQNNYLRAIIQNLKKVTSIRETEGLENLKEEYAGQKTGCIVLLAVHNQHDFNIFRKIITDTPIHCYIPAILSNERELLSSLLQYPLKGIIFFPLIEKEIAAIISRVLDDEEKREDKAAFFSGTSLYSQRLEWRTSDFPVFASAGTISTILQNYGFLDDPVQKANVHLALEEALINAVEHGNLELESDLKKNELDRLDEYENLKLDRMSQEAYAGRKITISISMDKSRVEIRIANEGKAFDHAKVLNESREKYTNKILEASGKGLMLIFNVFGRVFFEKDGKEIVLVLEKKK